MALLTRSADLRQAQHTSNIADIRIWKDAADANPALRPERARWPSSALPASASASSSRATGSSPRTASKLEAAFDGFATLADASHLVTRLRAVKSAEEIAYVRRRGGARRRGRRGGARR